MTRAFQGLPVLAGMAAKVHCETNLYGTFSNKNAFKETRIKLKFVDPWPQCPEVIPSKDNQAYCRDQNYSDSKKVRMEGYDAQHSKEILKQTMLKQEEIFRGQVRELHRLYHVQKLLMAELRNKEGTSKFAPPTRQTSPIMFQFGSDHIQPEGKRHFWDALTGSVTDKDNIGYRQPIWGMDRQQSISSDCLGQSIPNVLQEIKDSSQDLYRLQPSRATCRTFDLEQPAVEYMNDKDTYPNEEDTTLRIYVDDTAKLDRSSSFRMCLEPDTDVQLTLATGGKQSKTEQSGKQSRPSLGLSFPELPREQTSQSTGLLCGDEAKLFPVVSVWPETADQEKNGMMEGTRGTGENYIKKENYRAEWQRFDVEYERNRNESQSLDLQTGDISRRESLKQPPWLVQALNMNRT